MVSAALFQTVCQHPGIGSVRVHDPERRRSSGLGPAKSNELSIGRRRGSKIPGTSSRFRKGGFRSSLRIQEADFGPTLSGFGFEIAVEMIGVRTLRLEFPGHLRTR